MTEDRVRWPRARRLVVIAAVVLVAPGTLAATDAVVGRLHPAAGLSAGSVSSRTTPYAGPVWLGPRGLRVKAHDTARPTSVSLVRGGVVFGLADGNVYRQAYGGRAVRIGRHSPLGPVGDPAGATAAWFEDQDLVVFDTAAGEVEARTRIRPTLPLARTEDSPHPVLFVDERRVTFEAGGEVWDYGWRQHRDPAPSGPARSGLVDTGRGVDVLAGEPVVDGRTGGRSLARMTFMTAGRRLTTGLPLFREGSLSADGRYFAGSTGYDRGHLLAVFDVRTGRAVPLPRLVVGRFATPYKWSYGDTLLVRGGESRAHLVSCDVGEVRCTGVEHAARWPLLPG